MRDVFGWVGTLVEKRYEVDAVIGEGGFGLVYRAHHKDLGTPVAIKCLKLPAHFVPEAKELLLLRFRDEGRMLSKLSEHPNIVRVLDFGIAEDVREPVPYLVLEWLEGASLDALLAKRLKDGGAPFGERELANILEPAIDALAFAHELGIAHRDIKPANVFRARSARGETTKVLDFGIAKAMHEGEARTRLATNTSSGFHAFSPPYGAPEQFRPKIFGPTGPWTDVHALGLLMFELLTGKPMLEGEEVGDFFVASTADERTSPRRRGAVVCDGLEALCVRAAATEPRARFQNAHEMLEALRALGLSDSPTPAGATPVTLRSAAPVETHGTPAVAAPSEAVDTGEFLESLPGAGGQAPPPLEPSAGPGGDAPPEPEPQGGSGVEVAPDLAPPPPAPPTTATRVSAHATGAPIRAWLLAGVAAAAATIVAVVWLSGDSSGVMSGESRESGASGGSVRPDSGTEGIATASASAVALVQATPAELLSAARRIPGRPEHAALAWQRYNDERLLENLGEALAQAEKSCAAGNPDGCAIIGEAKRIGRGVPQDVRRAFAMLEHACRDGSELGCAQLGIMYAEGSGVAKDDARAVALYETACAAEVTRGCVNLGNSYRFGRGVAKDAVRAEQLYQTSCERGDMLGCRRLGELLDDPERRLVLYRQACEGGEMLGCNYLGDYYRDGRVVEADQRRAAKLYADTCDRGSIWGCYDLAVMYEYGRGVPKDEARALALAKKACDGETWGVAGHRKACDWVSTRRAPPEPKSAARTAPSTSTPIRSSARQP